MSDFKEYRGEMARFTIWTSENAGDLFKANRILIYENKIEFYREFDLVKSYNLSPFIKNNPELFEGIKLK